MVLAIFKRMFYNETRTYERMYERVVRVNQSENKEYSEYMTNEQYREELKKMFDNLDENYKLRWFYIFVKEKLRSSN